MYQYKLTSTVGHCLFQRILVDFFGFQFLLQLLSNKKGNKSKTLVGILVMFDKTVGMNVITCHFCMCNPALIRSHVHPKIGQKVSFIYPVCRSLGHMKNNSIVWYFIKRIMSTLQVIIPSIILLRFTNSYSTDLHT